MHPLAHRIDLGAFLRIGRRHRQRYQASQRINYRVSFGAVVPLVAVVPSGWPAFTTALRGPAIANDGAGLAVAASRSPDERAHVANQRLKAARLVPALELLVHNPGAANR